VSHEQFSQVLAQARALWVTSLAGQMQAHALVAPWLAAGMRSSDASVQAHAFLFAAFGARLQVSHHLAFDHAQKAAHLFRQVGDLTGEVQALTAQSLAASALARRAEAVESALLATRLAESLAPGLPAVQAHNYLGVAMFWAEQWDTADAAFARALDMAAQCEPPFPALEPAVNPVCAMGVRLILRRARGACVSAEVQAADLAELDRRARAAAHHVKRWIADPVSRPASETADATYWMARVLLLHAPVLAGQLDEVAPSLLEAEAHLAKHPSAMQDVHVMACLMRTLFDWIEGRPENRHNWQRLVAAAEARGHEALLQVGLEIGARQALDHGAAAEAADLLAQLRQRERQVKQDTLRSCERVVGWQLALRAQALQVRDLQSERQLLSRQSLEDPLTGLANRRALTQQLGLWLGQQRALSVVLLDLNGFKLINDRHSHRVGDQVLCQLAALLRQSLRGADLAARLGGDEFVLLLPDTPEAAAQALCQRVAEAVRAHPWGLLADGLAVGMSFGLVQARPGEAAADLLHRADLAMYSHKGDTPGRLAAPERQGAALPAGC